MSNLVNEITELEEIRNITEKYLIGSIIDPILKKTWKQDEIDSDFSFYPNNGQLNVHLSINVRFIPKDDRYEEGITKLRQKLEEQGYTFTCKLYDPIFYEQQSPDQEQAFKDHENKIAILKAEGWTDKKLQDYGYMVIPHNPIDEDSMDEEFVEEIEELGDLEDLSEE